MADVIYIKTLYTHKNKIQDGTKSKNPLSADKGKRTPPCGVIQGGLFILL